MSWGAAMSQGQRISLGVTVVCVAAVLTFACENAREGSPVSPSGGVSSGGFQSEPAATSSGMTAAPVIMAARPTTTPPAKPETARVAVHGTVDANPTGTCPAIAFTIGGVNVTTTSATKYEHGACTDVKKDVRVNVQGTKATDGVTATQVEVAGHDGGHAAVDEARGAIADLKGSCAGPDFTLTFRVGGAAFGINNATTFKGVVCSALHNGDYVEVKDAAKDKIADSVELLVRNSRPVEVSGTAASPAGDCTLGTFTFKVDTVSIVTNAHTRFHGVTCGADLKGKKVVVMGHLQTDGSVLAMKVSAERVKH